MVEHPRYSPKGKKSILIKIEEPDNESMTFGHNKQEQLSFDFEQPINEELLS